MECAPGNFKDLAHLLHAKFGAVILDKKVILPHELEEDAIVIINMAFSSSKSLAFFESPLNSSSAGLSLPLPMKALSP